MPHLDLDETIHEYQKNPEILNRLCEKLQVLDPGIENIDIIETPDAEMAFYHRGLDSPVALDYESEDVRKLALIFPMISMALEAGNVAVMDSLDSHFHTELVVEILNLFRREETNPHNAQLICSLHNPAVLEHLEKEEVYMVEKDLDGKKKWTPKIRQHLKCISLVF